MQPCAWDAFDVERDIDDDKSQGIVSLLLASFDFWHFFRDWFEKMYSKMRNGSFCTQRCSSLDEFKSNLLQ